MDNLNKLQATHHEGLKMKSTLVAEHKNINEVRNDYKMGYRIMFQTMTANELSMCI